MLETFLELCLVLSVRKWFGFAMVYFLRESEGRVLRVRHTIDEGKKDRSGSELAALLYL